MYAPTPGSAVAGILQDVSDQARRDVVVLQVKYHNDEMRTAEENRRKNDDPLVQLIVGAVRDAVC